MEEEDDDIYQRYFLDFQNALKSSGTRQSDSEQLRKELDEYVESLNSKLDSDGQSLLNVPSNFGVIANSMTRADLNSVDEAPWSKYLLEEGIGEQLSKDYNGRYDSVLETKDTKVQQGLAQIQWLDRQLKSLSAQDIAAKKKPSPALEVDDTFVTKYKLSNGAESTPTSARSHVVSTDSSKKISVEASVTASAPASARRTSKSASSQRTTNVDEAPSPLPFEQEYRLAGLMADSYSAPELGDALKEEYQQMSHLNTELGKYGRLERLSEGETESVPKSKTGKLDYLVQQRQQREENIYMEELDKLLAKCRTRATALEDVAGLAPKSTMVHSPSCSTSGNDSHHARTPSTVKTSSSTVVNQVPNSAKVNVDRLITREDIESLVESVVKENQCNVSLDLPLADATVEYEHKSLQPADNTKSPSAENKMAGNDSQAMSKEMTAQMEDLLNSYRVDIGKLALLKEQKVCVQLDEPFDLKAKAKGARHEHAYRKKSSPTKSEGDTHKAPVFSELPLSMTDEPVPESALKIDTSHPRIQKMSSSKKGSGITHDRSLRSGRRTGNANATQGSLHQAVDVSDQATLTNEKLPPIPAVAGNCNYPPIIDIMLTQRKKNPEDGRTSFPKLVSSRGPDAPAWPLSVFRHSPFVGESPINAFTEAATRSPPKSMRVQKTYVSGVSSAGAVNDSKPADAKVKVSI